MISCALIIAVRISKFCIPNKAHQSQAMLTDILKNSLQTSKYHSQGK